MTTSWDAEGDPFPLTPETWDEIRTRLGESPGDEFMEDLAEDSLWFRTLTKRQFDTHAFLTGAPSEADGYAFSYRARLPWRHPEVMALSTLSVTVPVRFLEERGPDTLRELALALAAPLPFSTGHAGLSFAYSRGLWRALPRIKEELFQHPGWGVPRAGSTMGQGAQVDGVHWLNFLGPPVLEAMGGPRTLRSRLNSPDTTVLELTEGRALVTLGFAPLPGDLKAGQSLPAYRELAKVLEPWMLKFSAFHTWDGFTEEEARRWWRRFLD
ncbi:type VI immunity family protein [Corallococcus sicarius]|uniref:type VI immunity family protein n=1 Tax=Corallococcus sicarius TaxID=2316726 RepID=UPI0013157029|nr:type VI immunity family protein [Corallococcus sicarius]